VSRHVFECRLRHGFSTSQEFPLGTCGGNLVRASYPTSELKRELVRRYKQWLYTLKYCKTNIQRYPRIAGEFCDSLRNRQIDEKTSCDIRSFLIHCARRKNFRTEAFTALWLPFAVSLSF
jgi:hypothetical protein